MEIASVASPMLNGNLLQVLNLLVMMKHFCLTLVKNVTFLLKKQGQTLIISEIWVHALMEAMKAS
jgi:hypothetical protein